ncbi:unnamed protein product [Notodromas monacha]|uniref:Uncharacterized protein n=1 Tax=Notodromas monacha TaxID=399045 RepID=A0A7R9BEI6_9CRUS|nr:unnamed protein product [Notodromas monacha]CAG0913902.1 unnamed protein product [Notodromas monacha]
MDGKPPVSFMLATIILLLAVVTSTTGKTTSFPCFSCDDEYECGANLGVIFCHAPMYDSCSTYYSSQSKRDVVRKGCSKGFGCFTVPNDGESPEDPENLFRCNCVGPLCNGNFKRYRRTKIEDQFDQPPSSSAMYPENDMVVLPRYT